MIGTTHLTNAFIQRRDLVPVFAIRAGFPAGRGIPPFSSWPDDLKSILCGGSTMVGGGYEYDGREIAPLDEAAIVDAIDEARAAGIRQRSEEHTSELQSLMRIPYAVFCLKKTILQHT